MIDINEYDNGLTADEQKMFDKEVARVCAGLKCSVGALRATTVDGMRYVEITSGPEQSGEETPVIHLTLEYAIAEWERRLRKYIGDYKRIVWRVEPEAGSQLGDVYVKAWHIDEDPLPLRPVRQYMIYSRLVAY